MARSRLLSFFALSLFAASVGACGGAKLTQAPGAPPSPESVTLEEPGGDAFDPHLSALVLQHQASWGFRTDKDQQARFPLPDRRKWRRVRFFLLDHFVGFTYGKKDPHAYSVGFVVPLPRHAPRTSAACIEAFELDSMPKIKDLGGEVSELTTEVQTWQENPLVVRRASGTVRFMLTQYDAAIAWAGYPAYPDSCLVYAVAVPWNGQQKLAEMVRDKWAKEGFVRFHPLTEDTPFRH